MTDKFINQISSPHVDWKCEADCESQIQILWYFLWKHFCKSISVFGDGFILFIFILGYILKISSCLQQA